MVEYLDNITHKRLRTQGVIEARSKEIAYVKKRNIYTKVHISEADGYQVIDTMWLDVNKGDEDREDIRSRIVGKEYNDGKNMDMFAAIPPIESLRYLLSRTATTKPNEVKKLLILDVSPAYVYAKATSPLFIKIPAEDFQKGDENMVGKLNLFPIRYSCCGRELGTRILGGII